MSVVKVYCKIETSPWAITLSEPVPEAFELPASDWPQKIFLWPISEDEQPGDSDVFGGSVEGIVNFDTRCATFTSHTFILITSLYIVYNAKLAFLNRSLCSLHDF